MSDSTIAISKTLVHEGGYTNSSSDPGGETNFGISKREYPNLDIKNLTQAQAIEIYKEGYWKNLYSQIESQAVAEKLFDLGVLFGVGTAITILQLTLGVVQDGMFGSGTLTAVNQAEEMTLLKSFKGNLATHAFNVVTAKPQERIFIQGWLNRINS